MMCVVGRERRLGSVGRSVMSKADASGRRRCRSLMRGVIILCTWPFTLAYCARNLDSGRGRSENASRGPAGSRSPSLSFSLRCCLLRAREHNSDGRSLMRRPRLEGLRHNLWEFAPGGLCDVGGSFGAVAGIDHTHWTGWGRATATGTGMFVDGLGFEYPAEITGYGLVSTHNFSGKQFYAKWYSKLHVIAQAELRGGTVRGPFDVVMNVTPDGIRAPKLKTKISVFYAFTRDATPTLHTQSKRGYCWTGSLAADRNDAWRCFVGNSFTTHASVHKTVRRGGLPQPMAERRYQDLSHPGLCHDATQTPGCRRPTAIPGTSS